MNTFQRKTGTLVAGLGLAAAAVVGGPALSASAAGETPGADSVSAAAAARPGFTMPFRCGQTWRGSAWTSYDGHPHSPLKSVDWNQGSQNDDKGRSVMASAGGTVEFAGVGSGGYGYTVVIRHNATWKTRYAHLLKGSIKVGKGKKVKKGQWIGRVGQSGGQPSAHLHYEQINNGRVVDAVVQGIRFDPNDVHYITSRTNC